MDTSECKRCGTAFQHYPSQPRLYCGAACRRAAGQISKPKTGRYKSCERCSQEFWVVPARESVARFCSVDCKNQPAALVQHVCVECDQSFTAWPSQNRRYCSNACAALHKTTRKGGPCETCGTLVDPRKNQSRFCSLTCSAAALRTGSHIPCGQCGTPVWRPPNQQSGATFCGQECKNEAARLKGPGHKCVRGGYVYVYYPSHPRASGNGSIAEHRLVVEELLGRALRRSEHVHHINGVKTDNRPENLEVVGAGEHARITVREAKVKRQAAAALAKAQTAELDEYRRRFGPLT